LVSLYWKDELRGPGGNALLAGRNRWIDPVRALGLVGAPPGGPQCY